MSEMSPQLAVARPDTGADALLVRLADAVRAERDATERIADLIVQGRERGVMWQDLAAASGLSVGQLQTRADRRHPSRVARIGPQPPIQDVIKRREPFEYEVSVTLAAQALGVARAEINRRARAGTLGARIAVGRKSVSLRIEATKDGMPISRVK